MERNEPEIKNGTYVKHVVQSNVTPNDNIDSIHRQTNDRNKDEVSISVFISKNLFVEQL